MAQTKVDVGEAPPLNDAQVKDILQIALDAGFWELDVDGIWPRDPDHLRTAAKDLVRQCRLHLAAGNKQQALFDILFRAEVDLNPSTTTDTVTKINSTEGENKDVSATKSEDLSGHSTELLQKLEKTLLNYPETDERERNLGLVRSELSSRGVNTAVEAPQPPQEGETIVPKQVVVQDQPTPQNGNGKISRADLENQLTFPIMRAHGIDPSELDSLSDENLQWVIDNPSGPGNGSPANEVDPAPRIPDPTGETVLTTQMVVNQPPAEEPPPPPKAPETVPTTSSDISPERLEMEEQVTGKMLKNYSRTRQDVADGSIGDNELRFMLDHQDGQVTPEQLAEAKAKDQGTVDAPATPEPQGEPELPADQVSAPEESAMEKAMREAAESEAAVDDGFTPEPEPEPQPKRRGRPPKAKPEETGPQVVQPPTETQSTPQVETPAQDPPAVPRGPLLKQDLPENPAAEIIDRESFPIPAEIEEPPHLPFDLSKLPDEEIRSYHSRMNAVHSRASYVLGLWESELRDEVKLRKGREIAVANSLPAKDPDDSRKSLTEAKRELMVQSDAQVIEHRDKEHEIEKIVRQLKGLESIYSRNVAACSRQLGRREDEREGTRA